MRLLALWCALGQVVQGKPVLLSDLLDVKELRRDSLSPTVYSWIRKEAGTVDCDCTFQVRIGVDSGQLPLLRLVFDNGKETVDLDPRNPRHERLARGPILCSSSDRRDDGPVLLSVSSTAEYLFRLWPSFVNKVLWAHSVGFTYYVWIGDLNEHLATTTSDACKESVEYQEFLVEGQKIYVRSKDSYYEAQAFSDKKEEEVVAHSNHHVKMLATLAALYDNKRPIRGVYYFDMDTFVHPKAFNDMDLFENALLRSDKDDRVDVLFGNGARIFWHIKGSSYYVRKNHLGKQLMSAWFGYRCGFKDQYSLWHVLLLFADHYNCLTYDDHIFKQNYVDARAAKDLDPEFDMDCHQRTATCKKFRFCVTPDPDHPFYRNKPLNPDIIKHRTIKANTTHTLNATQDNFTYTVANPIVLLHEEVDSDDTNNQKKRITHVGAAEEYMLDGLGLKTKIIRSALDNAPTNYSSHCPILK